MKIVVIGAGAMGSIYGGHLSQNNEVYIVDTNQSVVDAINANGLQIDENGVTNTYHPTAVTSTEGITDVDLVILFVKAIFSKVAHAMGLKADEEEIVKKVKETSVNNPNGCTSIRADLRVPRKTEVDTISGAVVRAAKEVGVEVPCHEFVVNMVHAMEVKDKE